MTERQRGLMGGRLDFRNSRYRFLRPLGDMGNWRQAADVISERIVPIDFYNSPENRWSTLGEMARSAIPFAGLFSGLFGGNRGQPIPGWMQPGAPMLGPEPYNGPGAPGWQPSVPGVEESPFNGSGPQRAFQRQKPRGVGVRGGQVLAEGPAAQRMVEGMQASARDAAMQEAQRQWQQRAAMMPK